jgi:hypothetical protein
MATFAENVKKYLPILDQLYVQESITAIFERSGVIFSGTKEIKIPTISVDGNADYDRTAGYKNGGIAVAYQTKTLTHDRGRKFNVDAVENDEVPMDLVVQAMSTFEKEKNIPEVDAIRFAALSQLAGNKVSATLADAAGALAAYDAAEKAFKKAGIAMNNCLMFCSADYYALLKNAVAARLIVNQNSGDLNRNVDLLDGKLPVITVADDRFYDQISLLTGGTGEEAGGFEPIEDTSHRINFLIVDRAVPQAVTKRAVTKVISPEANQTHDGYSIFYRSFHDIYINDNQAKRLYAHVSAAVVNNVA